MAAPNSVLPAADREALLEGFGLLESGAAGLAERLIRFVTEGDDADVQAELLSTPEAGTLLGLDFLYNIPRLAGKPPPAWDALLDHPAQVPAEVLLRLAKVLTAAAWSPCRPRMINQVSFQPQLAFILKPLSPPPWLEILLRAGSET